MAAGAERALKYPLGNLRSLGIGGIYLLFYYIIYFAIYFAVTLTDGSLLLLPVVSGVFFALPLYGYMVRVSRSIFSGEKKPPGFGGIKDLFVTGFKMLVVLIPYMFLFFVVFLIIISPIFVWENTLVMVISVLIASILGFIVIMGGYIGVIHFAKTDSVREGARVLFIYGLVRANLWEFVVSIIKYIAVAVAFFITMIFVVTIPFSMFAYYISFQYIFTIFYIDATEKQQVQA